MLQSSKGNYSKSVNARVMVLALCTRLTISKGNNSKSINARVTYLNSACHLILVDICMKIHEDSLKAFQVVERTKQLRRNLVMVEVPWEIIQKV